MDIKDAVKELRKDPALAGSWPAWALEVWLRDRCKCVYCGRDMLESRDIGWFLYATDHLLPQSKYPQLAKKIWNQVLACAPCNAYKGALDPSGGNVEAIADPHRNRDLWLRNALAHVSKKRIELDSSFEAQRPRIAEMLNALYPGEKGVAAGAGSAR